MWTAYRKVGLIEMRPYVPGEDLAKVSVRPDYTPAAGDMIARNPADQNDQWLVAADFAAQHYEPVPSPTMVG